ncbi:hypothetical protein [Parasphingorhabdus sp.]|uniref:hypothetical protein n=1 Tax=Parasphingorhabdus sp. TaxID=2709688 RepID=UPI003A91761A
MPTDPVRPQICRRDSASLLTSQIQTLAGDQACVILERERRWASITFTGTLYSFSVDWAGSGNPRAAQNLAKVIPDHDFAIAGHFIADILVTKRSGNRVQIEALSIIDPVEDYRNQ